MGEELAAEYLRAVLTSDVNRGAGPGGHILSAALGLGGPQQPHDGDQGGEDDSGSYGDGEPDG